MLVVFVAVSWSCLNLSIDFFGVQSLFFYLAYVVFSQCPVFIRDRSVPQAALNVVPCLNTDNPVLVWRAQHLEIPHRFLKTQLILSCKAMPAPKKPEGSVVSPSSSAAGAAQPGWALPCSC